MTLYGDNVSLALCQTNKRSRPSEYSDVNDTLYDWYQLACSKNIYPNGALLTEKAKEIAKHLGKDQFKASNGWLDKWKKKHNIKQLVISGESGDVSGATVDSWKERLPEICEKYTPERIWNMDETGCFWKALPDKGLGQFKKACKGGKKSKLRVTVAFFVNAAGKKEKPVVIYKSAKPRCFKRIDKRQLPVSYFHQNKAWMSGDIMNSILSKLNTRLISQNYSILLFMDNAGCHPDDLRHKYSNIKVVFLPANTTSVLQPLDLGIIQTFKMHYRKLLLTYVLSKIAEATSAAEIVKSVNVLQAIRWNAQAWSNVSSETIMKCFRKAGFLDKDFQVVARNCDEDPFADLDDSMDTDSELAGLVQKLCGDDDYSPDEYVNCDEETPVCREYDDDEWNGSFFNELDASRSRGTRQRDQESSDDEDDEEEAPLPPKIKSYTEAN